MTRKVENSTDFISDLPPSILHHILSYLDPQDSVRISVLSKQWNSVWKSFPFLEIKRPVHMWEYSPRFKERFREYLYSVDRSLQNFIKDKRCIERLNLHLSSVDPSSVPLVNTYLPLALHNGVFDLRFEVSIDGEYDYPLPETTFTVNSKLLRGSSNFFLLKKLELTSICLTEKIVGDIIRNCPNLTDLRLLRTQGLETLNISKLSKLVSLTITVIDAMLMSIIVDVLSLKRFSLEIEVAAPECDDTAIHLTSCSNLRELDLKRSAITDAHFSRQISRFRFLECLYIELKRIKLSLKRLKHLKLCCTSLEAIEIDAPILSEFVFESTTEIEEELPVLILADAIPGSLHLTYYMGGGLWSDNSVWFLKFREFLSAPFKSTTFELELRRLDKKVSFHLDEFKESIIPPPVTIDRLDLTGCINKPSSYWEALLDGILWSCHPKKICMTNISPTSSDEDAAKKCLQTLCRMLNQSECQLCCNLSRCECWRRHFKAATIESTGDVEFDETNIEDVTGDLFSKLKYRKRLYRRAKINSCYSSMECSVTFRFDWEI